MEGFQRLSINQKTVIRGISSPAEAYQQFICAPFVCKKIFDIPT